MSCRQFLIHAYNETDIEKPAAALYSISNKICIRLLCSVLSWLYDSVLNSTCVLSFSL